MRKPNALLYGYLVPGLAHAKTVHVAHFHVGYHLRRRNGNYFYFALVYFSRSQPVTQPDIVRAARVSHGKGEFFLGLHLVYSSRYTVNIPKANLATKILGERNGLAVVIKQHGNFQFGAGFAAHPR